jgi:ResB-like family
MFKSKKSYSIIIPLCLFVVGIIIQSFFGNFPLNAFRFPKNLIVIIEVFLLIVLLHLFLRRNVIVKYLSSTYAAISAISLFTVLVVLMVLLPQNTSSTDIMARIGLYNIIHSWSYTFAVLYLLLSLGLISIKRLFPINIRNVFFFINHFGLWMVLAFGNLGQADKVSMMMTVPEGEIVWYGYDNNENYIEPDFAIKLNAFIIDYYPPKLALMDNEDKLVEPRLFQAVEMEVNQSINALGTTISVLDIVEDAILADGRLVGFSSLPEKTFVAILKLNTDTIYIQNGTNFYPPVVESLNEDYKLIMLNPEPKYFASDIDLFTKSGISNEKHLVEVNNPLKIGSWTVYQTSYFKNSDYQSYVTVLTAVFDPWLKAVYLGLMFMFIGAVYLIFSRRILNKKKE